MKPNRHQLQDRDDYQKAFYRTTGSSRAETAMFATLGLMAFIAVVVATISGSIPVKSGEDPLIRYVHSGQLAADVRTATAVVHYFFEREPALATNTGPSCAQKAPAMSAKGVSS
jgi:hypothetical protein